MASGNRQANTSLEAQIKDQAALAEVEALLDGFTHFGVELGLERIQRLLADLGNPQQQVPVLHVAGSNGKGSVCAYLSSVLTEASYRVGCYTSPHLINWCERICINQQEIAPADLHRILQQVLAAICPDQPSPTQFEVITAAAWLYFAEQAVDIAVIEVGLGGRLDATNVCDRPLVSLITSLSREHWQKLGPTLADITREKAGILKHGCPAVIAPQPTEATAVLQQRLLELNCPAVWVEPSLEIGGGWAEFRAEVGEQKIEGRRQSARGRGGREEEGEGLGVGSKNWEDTEPQRHKDTKITTPPPLHPSTPPPLHPSSFILHPFQYPLPLPGLHQLTNSALAIAALQILQQQGWAISQQSIVQGMAKTEWPGRLQWFKWRQRSILIDGAHNPAGAEMLRHYVDHSDRATPPMHWVMGMIATKDHADVFKALLRSGDALFLVPVPDHLSAELSPLATLAREICPGLSTCEIHDHVFAGLEAAAQHQIDQQQIENEATIVLCGSLYLIGHFFKNCH